MTALDIATEIFSRPQPKAVLVDDNSDDTFMCSRVIRKAGYVVDVIDVDTAFDSVDLIYDMAVIDLKLGHKSGLDLAKKFRRLGSIGCVVILTGSYDGDPAISEALKEGFVIFPKPLTAENLRKISAALSPCAAS